MPGAQNRSSDHGVSLRERIGSAVRLCALHKEVLDTYSAVDLRNIHARTLTRSYDAQRSSGGSSEILTPSFRVWRRFLLVLARLSSVQGTQRRGPSLETLTFSGVRG